jgi:poly-gamma-glutamate capsule biosynthesis protein CapA/YwtB (metallophosphatase superfamily)
MPNYDSSSYSVKNSDNVSIVSVGDIMPGSAYPSSSLLPPKNGEFLFSNCADVLKTADICFGNLETCILNEGSPEKECVGEGACYYFRTPESSAKLLKNAGFDILNIGNNHIADFGYPGLINTQKALSENDLKFCGIKDKVFDSILVNNKKVKFLGFGFTNSTVNINDLELCAKIVKDNAATCDILVVSFHGGAEGQKAKRITKDTEMFYGEKRGDVYKFAHAMIDAGADLILGHGPHVPRAIELYNNKLIAYSLGNFCTYRQMSLAGSAAFAPALLTNLDKNGNFISGRIYSFKQKAPGIPLKDPKENALKEIVKLTYLDFPDSKIYFDGAEIKKK